MSLGAERSLALMAAEDGDLHDAEQSLTDLIARVEHGPGADPSNGHSVYELCRCLLDRANVRSWAVRPSEALEDLARVERLSDGLKPLNRHLLRVGLLDSRARLLSAPFSPVHDPAAAQLALMQLRHEIQTPGDTWMADVVELRLAQHARDWRRVVDLAPATLARLTELDASRGVQALRLQVARAWLELDRPDQAADLAEAAYAFFAREGPPDIAAQAAMALARAHGWAEGWVFAEEALTLIEQLTRRQRSLFDQQRYLVEKLQVYDDALGLALDAVAKSAAPAERERAILRAWQVAEQAKSFSLRQAMTQGGWLEAIDPDCAAELASLDQRLEAVEAQAERSEAAAQLQTDLIAQRQQVLQAAMQRSPMLTQTAAAPELDLARVLRQLPAGVGVVSWYWLVRPESRTLHIFHAGADGKPRYIHSEFTADEMAALDQARRKCVETQRPFRIQQILPAALGDKVFPHPLLEHVSTCHTLLLTPHRNLRQVPLHAAELTVPGSAETKTGLLIERFAVQVLPTLALPFPSHAPREEKSHVLLMGCHIDGFHHEALDDVPLELQDLAEIWRSAGHDVHPHALSQSGRLAQHVPLPQWSDFDVIHLACHGRFIPGSPLDATLYLGSEALRASEFFGLSLHSDVVCLSACDVGQQGDTLDGLTLVSDEWLGLALPLFQAGARSLLFSLWKADSGFARTFMQHFHEALAEGLDPARAHQRACLAQIRDRRRFGFWANWQLAGFPT